MRKVNVVILTPDEFEYYENFEKAVKNSVFVSDYDDSIQKVVVKVRKNIIEEIIKNNEAFAEIPKNVIKIEWI